MRPSKAQIKKWTEALRSGKYSQTKNTLQDTQGFCCLGVACDVFVPDYAKTSDGYLDGLAPELGRGAPVWLNQIDRDFNDLTTERLSTLNDAGAIGHQGTNLDRFTFDEIADVLEAVYIHEVLK